MSLKSRVGYVVAVASLVFVSACSETSTTEPNLTRKAYSYDELVAMGCGDTVPWGYAHCVVEQSRR